MIIDLLDTEEKTTITLYYYFSDYNSYDVETNEWGGWETTYFDGYNYYVID